MTNRYNSDPALLSYNPDLCIGKRLDLRKNQSAIAIALLAN
ncbi:MAG: hypothetical protein V7K48_12725 [Nostoc sp.]